MTSCAAIFRRSGDIFLRVNRPFSDWAAGFSSATFSVARAGVGADAGGDLRFCAAVTASFLVTRFLVPDGNDPARDRFADGWNFHFDAHEGVTLCAKEARGRTATTG